MSKLSKAKSAMSCLTECGALIDDDHFVYVSGNHGAGWVAKELLLIDPLKTYGLVEQLAKEINPSDFDIICAPVTGGLVVGQFLGLAMNKPVVYADRNKSKSADAEPFILKRGFDEIVNGKRVLLVDDVTNTGYSLQSCIRILNAAQANIVAAACLVDRGNVEAEDLGFAKYYYLARVNYPVWTADECPLCKKGMPVNKQYAYGRDFISKQRKNN